MYLVVSVLSRLKCLTFDLYFRSGGLLVAKWHGSRSKVTWVKAKGHIGQGPSQAHDIGRWAHINVKFFSQR